MDVIKPGDEIQEGLLRKYIRNGVVGIISLVLVIVFTLLYRVVEGVDILLLSFRAFFFILGIMSSIFGIKYSLLSVEYKRSLILNIIWLVLYVIIILVLIISSFYLVNPIGAIFRLL